MQSESQVDKEFLAPVAISFGVTSLFNFTNVFPTSINALIKLPLNGWITLIFGLLLIIYGCYIAPRNMKLVWRICMMVGTSLFFFGVRIASSYPSMDLIIKGPAVILLVVGLSFGGWKRC